MNQIIEYVKVSFTFLAHTLQPVNISMSIQRQNIEPYDSIQVLPQTTAIITGISKHTYRITFRLKTYSMNKIRLLLLLIGFFVQSHAIAANNPYMEFQYSYFNAEVAGQKFHPSTISAIFGYPLFKYMGIEIIMGAGLGADELKIKTLFGTYISASLPVSYNFDIFGRAGFNSISYEYVTSGSDMGASFGLGIALLVSENSSLTLEFRTLPELNNEITSNAIVLGWKYK